MGVLGLVYALDARPTRAPGSERHTRVNHDQTRHRWIEPVAWIVALAAAAVLLVAADARTGDPDSELHRAIAEDLAHQPADRWIAPSWGGHWNRTDLYREHPAGIVVMPQLLIRLGYPAGQAAYLVNALFQVLTIILVRQLAVTFVPPGDARALAWLLQLLPVAFAYRIRANHEQVLLAMVLLALVATERSRSNAAWGGVTACAVTLALLVKGVFAVMLPVTCAVWLIARPAEGRAARIKTWAGLAGAVLAAAGAAAWYEHAYLAATGESFVGPYLRQQLGLAAVQRSPGAAIAQKLQNGGWYLGRIAWFAFPFSLVLLWRGLRAAHAQAGRTAGRGAVAGPGVRRAFGQDARALALVLGLAALYVAAFCLSDRRADRYIFPVYFLVGGAGAAVALRTMPLAGRLASRVARLGPLDAVAVWLLTFLLALPGGVWRALAPGRPFG